MNSTDKSSTTDEDNSSSINEAALPSPLTVKTTAPAETAPVSASTHTAAFGTAPPEPPQTGSSSAQSATSGSGESSASVVSSDMKRSAVKQLIERYFYQLQRGCGNPECTNHNCASSGLVQPMTANEFAAKAIQLFSHDAKLCDFHSQPPKVPRTQIESPITSGSLTASTSSSIGSSTATTITTGSSNVPGPITSALRAAGEISSDEEDDVQLDKLLESTTTTVHNRNSNQEIITGSLATVISSPPSTPTPEVLRPLSPITENSPVTDEKDTPENDTPWPPLINFNYLDESIIDELLADYDSVTNPEMLLHAIHRVYSDVDRLGFSYRRKLPRKVVDEPAQSSSVGGSSKLDQLKLKSPRDLKKEDIRQLEGEADKDEDSKATAATVTAISETRARGLQEIDQPSNMNNSRVLVNRRAVGNRMRNGNASRNRAPRVHLHQFLEFHFDDSEEDEDENDEYQNTEADDDDDVDDDASDPTLNRTAAFWYRNPVEPLVANDNTATVDCSNGDVEVDFESLRRVNAKLYALNDTAISDALINNIIIMADSIRLEYDTIVNWEVVLHCVVIGFDMATNTSNRFVNLEYFERSLPKLCLAASILPHRVQARLSRIWATNCKDQLQSLVQCCQQLISLQVIVNDVQVQENDDVIAVTKVLKIAFYANILAGKLDSQPKCIASAAEGGGEHATAAPGGDSAVSGNPDAPSCSNGRLGHSSMSSFVSDDAAAALSLAADEDDDEDDDDDDVMFMYSQMQKTHIPKFPVDKLEKELGISTVDCREPLVPFEEFYNEPLSDAIQMDRDYLKYKNFMLNPVDEDMHFSFMMNSFILTPATKVVALYYDSRIRMYNNSTVLYDYLGDNGELGMRSDFKLKVRRDNIINDALISLEIIAISNPKDLKKQLVVEFDGEQGIDEGGVSKEFFQLVIEEVFNPDFGMFVQQTDTNTVWFNTTTFENDAQFTLIGIILGLAIYNNIILAVNFPTVVYRKLMGINGTFYDLQDFNPTLFRSLKSLLDYEDDDFEEVFMQTFRISYANVFGETVVHDLKPNGDNIMVTLDNRQEFVDMYADHILNSSIQRQFNAFKKGFEMVTDESPLKLLFRPEEIELLVCGSPLFDFVELEKFTKYEGGFTKDSKVIKDFWSIVHSMPEESKRKLLEFTTGSHRVPVGGFSRLKMMITRHGPDSDRLPTSHTCFNVLLMPEYSSKEKLEDRLLKAINNCKGFGML